MGFGKRLRNCMLNRTSRKISSSATMATSAIHVNDTPTWMSGLGMNPMDRKGCLWYAALRSLQLRRFRLRPPMVKRGQSPRDT